jgi:hypothetical protein
VCEVVHSFSFLFLLRLLHILLPLSKQMSVDFANVLGRLSNLAITVVKTENLKHTFHAANELGQGAIARAFKHSEIDAVALRLVFPLITIHFTAIFYCADVFLIISLAL